MTFQNTRAGHGLISAEVGQVSEFVHIRIEDLFLDGDPPQIHIVQAKRGADRYVPVLLALADELG